MIKRDARSPLLWPVGKLWMIDFKTVKRTAVTRLALGICQFRQVLAPVMFLVAGTAGELVLIVDRCMKQHAGVERSRFHGGCELV